MAPKIIADSDGDESEPHSPSHIPNDDVERTKSSPHGTDHQSVSTDPSFFNSVFNEQQDAAREQPTNYDVIDLAEESEASAFVSFDQGYERIERGKAPIEKSLWDVPSSPEIMKPKRSAKRKAESNTRTKITRGLRRHLDDIGYRSPDDEPTTPDIPSKRRRVQAKTGMTDDLPSTISHGSDESLLVVPKACTPSRKAERLSRDGFGGLSPPTQMQPLKPCSMNIRSSGSATNINTPREAFTPLVKSFSPGRPSSSAPEDVDVRQKEMSPPRSTSMAVKVDDEPAPTVVNATNESERDDALYQEEAGSRHTTPRRPRGRPKRAIEATSTTEESVVAVKVKKKRGRPKKSGKPDENDDKTAGVSDEASPDMTPVAEGKSPARERQMDRDNADGASLQESKAMETGTENKAQPPPTTPTSRAENTDGPVKQDVMTKKADAASSSASRQLYRVGLSKRTKIAPLLKIIRK
ncbi:hypothetical protein E4U53_002973 [Claviceps sorghi]|nr:hypothetical protein E4U53_002973 [Claviceps sorghi]